MRAWRNWQPRQAQTLLVERSWKFESSCPHHERCQRDENGRHARFRVSWEKSCASSNLAAGTKFPLHRLGPMHIVSMALVRGQCRLRFPQTCEDLLGVLGGWAPEGSYPVIDRELGDPSDYPLVVQWLPPSISPQ